MRTNVSRSNINQKPAYFVSRPGSRLRSSAEDLNARPQGNPGPTLAVCVAKTLSFLTTHRPAIAAVIHQACGRLNYGRPNDLMWTTFRFSTELGRGTPNVYLDPISAEFLQGHEDSSDRIWTQPQLMRSGFGPLFARKEGAGIPANVAVPMKQAVLEEIARLGISEVWKEWAALGAGSRPISQRYSLFVPMSHIKVGSIVESRDQLRRALVRQEIALTNLVRNVCLTAGYSGRGMTLWVALRIQFDAGLSDPLRIYLEPISHEHLDGTAVPLGRISTPVGLRMTIAERDRLRSLARPFPTHIAGQVRAAVRNHLANPDFERCIREAITLGRETTQKAHNFFLFVPLAD